MAASWVVVDICMPNPCGLARSGSVPLTLPWVFSWMVYNEINRVAGLAADTMGKPLFSGMAGSTAKPPRWVVMVVVVVFATRDRGAGVQTNRQIEPGHRSAHVTADVL